MADGDAEWRPSQREDPLQASHRLLDHSAATLAAEGSLSLAYQVNVMSRDVVPRQEQMLLKTEASIKKMLGASEPGIDTYAHAS